MNNPKVLNNLLKKIEIFHPLYGDRLASHLPMELCALYQLGASDEKLESTYQVSAKKLEVVVKNRANFPIDEITQDLGNSEKYQGYLNYFQNKIDSLGVKEVLKITLSILLPGISASAFHALIRLAYGIEFKNKNEIAISLAYWYAEFQSFELSNETTEEKLENILLRFSTTGENYQFSPCIIVDRMSEISDVMRSKESIFQPKENFTLLHAVTSCHALRVVLPFVENKELALREFWKAILVAYLSTGLSFSIGKKEELELDCDFNEVITLALKSSNSHTIKLVYSCFREYQMQYEPLYYFIAQRAVS